LYHVTTLENWKQIQRTECLDPKKTVIHPESGGGHHTLFVKSESAAVNLIKAPDWIVRNTDGYILLRVEVPKAWVKGLPSAPHTAHRVPLERITFVKELPKNKPNIIIAVRGAINGTNSIVFMCRSVLDKDFYYLAEQYDDGSKEMIGFGDRAEASRQIQCYRSRVKYKPVDEEDPAVLWR